MQRLDRRNAKKYRNLAGGHFTIVEVTHGNHRKVRSAEGGGTKRADSGLAARAAGNMIVEVFTAGRVSDRFVETQLRSQGWQLPL